MGLTIHYDFSQPNDLSYTKALDLIHRLRQEALDLPFDDVSLVQEIRNYKDSFDLSVFDKPDFEADDLLWLKFQAVQYIQVQPRDKRFASRPCIVPAMHAIGFYIDVGDLCESLEVGLVFYPKTFSFDGKRIKLKDSGWSWKGFCKTQYANSTVQGLSHFMRCHLSVIALMDKAIELDLAKPDDILDEGGFYLNRSIEDLVNEIREWDEMIAGLGIMTEAFGFDGAGAPINHHPNLATLREIAREKLPAFLLVDQMEEAKNLREVITSLDALAKTNPGMIQV